MAHESSALRAVLAAAFKLQVTFLQLKAVGHLDLGKRNRFEAIDIATIRATEVCMNIMVMPGTARGGAGGITGHTVCIHDAVCQPCLLEGLQYPEERNAVRLVGERALHVAMRQRLVAAVKQIEHGQPRIGDPKLV